MFTHVLELLSQQIYSSGSEEVWVNALLPNYPYTFERPRNGGFGTYREMQNIDLERDMGPWTAFIGEVSVRFFFADEQDALYAALFA